MLRIFTERGWRSIAGDNGVRPAWNQDHSLGTLQRTQLGVCAIELWRSPDTYVRHRVVGRSTSSLMGQPHLSPVPASHQCGAGGRWEPAFSRLME